MALFNKGKSKVLGLHRNNQMPKHRRENSWLGGNSVRKDLGLMLRRFFLGSSNNRRSFNPRADLLLPCSH